MTQETTAPDSYTAPISAPWQRDLVIGMLADNRRPLADWARSVAHHYSCSGSLEVTAVIWALLAENERLRAALTAQVEKTQEIAAELAQERAEHQQTLADLRRQRERADRYRDMHDERAKELSAERAKIMRLAMAKCWTNEDGKRFMFVSDIQAALGLPVEDTTSEVPSGPNYPEGE